MNYRIDRKDGRRGHEYTPDEEAVLRAVDRWRSANDRGYASITDVVRIMVSMGWRPPPEKKQENNLTGPD